MGMGETSLSEKTMLAGGALTEFSLVKMGADDDSVVLAAAVSDVIIGVVQGAVASGERCQVMTHGISRVKTGGAITRGGYVTTDAAGLGVAPAPAAGTNNNVIGIALKSASSGDIIPVLLSPGRIQG